MSPLEQFFSILAGAVFVIGCFTAFVVIFFGVKVVHRDRPEPEPKPQLKLDTSVAACPDGCTTKTEHTHVDWSLTLGNHHRLEQPAQPLGSHHTIQKRADAATVIRAAQGAYDPLTVRTFGRVNLDELHSRQIIRENAIAEFRRSLPPMPSNLVYGIFGFESGEFFHVDPPTQSNALRELALLNEPGHSVVTEDEAKRLSNAFSHGRMHGHRQAEEQA